MNQLGNVPGFVDSVENGTLHAEPMRRARKRACATLPQELVPARKFSPSFYVGRSITGCLCEHYASPRSRTLDFEVPLDKSVATGLRGEEEGRHFPPWERLLDLNRRSLPYIKRLRAGVATEGLRTRPFGFVVFSAEMNRKRKHSTDLTALQDTTENLGQTRHHPGVAG